jgi:hypothetical protein
LWSFLVKEYVPDQQVGNAFKNMFKNHFNMLLTGSDPTELGIIFNIIDEYILADLIDYSDFPGIIKIVEEKYILTLKDDLVAEEIYDMKCASISLMTTILLNYIARNAINQLPNFDVYFLYPFFL